MKDFKTSEKVKTFFQKFNNNICFHLQIHFLLLVSEAKLQSSLLYAMRAVSEYFN